MKLVTAVLVAISAVGMVGLPLGDPKFLPVGIALEAGFIALAVLSVKRVKSVVIPSIAIACIVIAGNTLSPTHIDIMLTLTPIYNAIILLIGGYMLQGLLIIASIKSYMNVKYRMKDKLTT
jgi:predicted branched-subunit amino acid permease